MKKFLCVLLCFVFVLLCGCSPERSEEEGSTVLYEYVNSLETEPAVREYGTEKSYSNSDSGIYLRVYYPETGYELLDNKISDWTGAMVKKYSEQAKDDKDKTALLTVSYNSYLVGVSIVSIEMKGTYYSFNASESVDFAKVFTADISEERLMGVKDIISEKRFSEFEAFAAEKAGVNEAFVDGHLLDDTVIAKQGIKIILKNEIYFPETEGLTAVELSYEELVPFLDEDFDYINYKDEVSVNDVAGEDGQTAVDPDKPMLALTFDDGPGANTGRLLDIFKKHGGKGTFFVLGNLIDRRKDTVKRIVDEGHDIGGHTWSHKQLTKLTAEEMKEQIMQTRAKIYEVTGTDTLLVRPPYGAIDDNVKAVGKELSVAFINWSVDTRDWKTKNADAVYNEIIKHASDGAIILCHDLYKTTVDALEYAIPKLIADGYQLVTVSQLIEYSGNTIVPGGVYFRQ